MICFKCGRQGHKGLCPYFPDDAVPEKGNGGGEAAMEAEQELEKAKKVNPQAGYLFTWMVAESPKSRRKAMSNPENQGVAQNKDKQSNRSRFAALSEDNGDNVIVDLEDDQERESNVKAWANGVGKSVAISHDGAKRVQVSYKAHYVPKSQVAGSYSKAQQGSRSNKAVPATQQNSVTILKRPEQEDLVRETEKVSDSTAEVVWRDKAEGKGLSLSQFSPSPDTMKDADVRFQKPPDDNIHPTVVGETQFIDDDTPNVVNDQDNMVLEPSPNSFVYESHLMEE